MAILVVRNLENKIVNGLKKRDAQHGKYSEAEHRSILEETLLRTNKQSYAEAILSIPNVDHDKDFERIEETHGKPTNQKNGQTNL